MPTTPAEFFSIVFGDKHPAHKILVWTVDSRLSDDDPDKRISVWCPDVESAAGACASVSGVRDVSVYCGVSTVDRDLGPRARGKEADMSAIYALWADIDFHKEGSKKTYPPDRESVKILLGEMPFAPSMTVFTGGGIHAWWLFREPWIFDGDDDRKRAFRLSRRWQKLLQQKAARFGWTIDSTFDLPRVLRPAGTTNWKYSEEVRIQTLSEARYNPVDIEDEISTYNIPDGDPVQIETVGNITLNPDIQIPHEVGVLSGTDAKFSQTWSRTRKDLVSQSEYDLAIASLAAAAGVSDQKIADMIVSHRRIHGEDLKLRADYYLRTIAKGRSESAASQARQKLGETVDNLETGKIQRTDDVKKTIRDHLSNVFGFKVTEIVKYVSDTPSYVIKTERGNITLPDVGCLTSQKKFTDCVAAATEKVLTISRKEFPGVSQAILNAVEYRELGADGFVESRVTSWLQHYFSDVPPIRDKDEAGLQRQPFIMNDDGDVAFFMETFRNWVFRIVGEKTEGRSLPTMLRAAGCEPKVVNLKSRIGSKRSTTYVWVAPARMVKHED